MLHYSAQTYRRAIWDEQTDYVEIGLKKEALAGVILDVTAEWDVPLMVTRGYPSLSYLYEAADALQDQGKPCYLYYFGDWDPSGVDITRCVRDGLREFAPDVELTFRRVAVTMEQVEYWGLQTRPTKKGDKRGAFEGDSIEVDAISPDKLPDLVRTCIELHVDLARLARLQTVEEAERETLLRVIEGLEASP